MAAVSCVLLFLMIACNHATRKEVTDRLKADFSMIEEYKSSIDYQGFTTRQTIHIEDSSYLAVQFRECGFPGVKADELDALSREIASRLEQRNNLWGIYEEVRITYTADSAAAARGYPGRSRYIYRKEDF